MSNGVYQARVRTTDPTDPPTDYWNLYSVNGEYFAQDENGVIIQLGAPAPAIPNPVAEYLDSDLNIAAATSGFVILPATTDYDAFRITAILRSTTAANNQTLRVRLNNNSTAGNYASQRIEVDGATVVGGRDTTGATVCNGLMTAANRGAAHFSILTLTLYNVIDTAKSVIAKWDTEYLGGADTTLIIRRGSGIYTPTNVITRIDISGAADNLAAGSGWVLEGLRYAG